MEGDPYFPDIEEADYDERESEKEDGGESEESSISEEEEFTDERMMPSRMIVTSANEGTSYCIPHIKRECEALPVKHKDVGRMKIRTNVPSSNILEPKDSELKYKEGMTLEMFDRALYECVVTNFESIAHSSNSHFLVKM